MNIVDIVNRDVFQITNCDQEPIHIPGSIQPHGVLLGINIDSRTIKYCSANISQLGIDPKDALNQPMDNILPDLWGKASVVLDVENKRPFRIEIASTIYCVSVHKTVDTAVLELERCEAHIADEHELFDHTRDFVMHIERASTLKTLCQHIASDTRKITGYDRVMIYRFDRDYNGEVYAESKVEDMEPFLGLHYPHTDIPPQARELYLKTLVRVIGDVLYEPVPILTLSDNGGNQLDLSHASLRSVSPIHIQYLKNMGVGASLTISLLQDGRLWGLIACHHRTPKTPTHMQRQFALLQGYFLTSQIKVRQAAEEYHVNVNAEAHLQQLLNKINADEDFEHKFEQFTSLLSVANATGAIILHNGTLYEKGLVPSPEKTLELIKWIESNINSASFSTSNLSKRYPKGADISKCASGIIYHALGKPTKNCIIWFREEVVQTVNWAGKPDTAVQRDPTTKSLTPRNSFDIWSEKVHQHATEWRVSEINAAMRFATSLQNQFHLTYLQREESNLRVLNEKLQKANEELTNINWITSHDLKEPLRKIQIFASRIASKEGQHLSDEIKDHTTRIQKSAKRMQLLLDDILSYSLTGNDAALYSIADLNPIVNEVKEALSDEIEAKRGSIKVHTLPSQVRVVPSQMLQLFTNLISNSIKFAENGNPPDITVSSSEVVGQEVKDAVLPDDVRYHQITVADNGIGFDESHRKRIFDIFYRLHNRDSNYEGTGIGLAICKKIAENHQGAITADSKEGKGATFNIYLPAS
ncbi:MAG: GAF domain-containing protein [Sphingobacteriales bacterium]|nr:MAG: GAF domain-containing protein [Sphingobacteriales bacterium]